VIPQEPLRRKAWLDAIGSANIKAKLLNWKDSFVCGLHFRSEDYSVSGQSRLLRSALPLLVFKTPDGNWQGLILFPFGLLLVTCLVSCRV